MKDEKPAIEKAKDKRFWAKAKAIGGAVVAVVVVVIAIVTKPFRGGGGPGSQS